MAALRMSLAVSGESGFKASRSIRRLLGKQRQALCWNLLECGGRLVPPPQRQDAGSTGWGRSGREQDASLPKRWREGTASRQRGLEGQRPRGRTPGAGTEGRWAEM